MGSTVVAIEVEVERHAKQPFRTWIAIWEALTGGVALKPGTTFDVEGSTHMIVAVGRVEQ